MPSIQIQPDIELNKLIDDFSKENKVSKADACILLIKKGLNNESR